MKTRSKFFNIFRNKSGKYIDESEGVVMQTAPNEEWIIGSLTRTDFDPYQDKIRFNSYGTVAKVFNFVKGIEEDMAYADYTQAIAEFRSLARACDSAIEFVTDHMLNKLFLIRISDEAHTGYVLYKRKAKKKK